MSEDSDSSQEKSEEATPKRMQKARDDGQVARSKELATMMVLIFGAAGLLIFGGMIGSSMLAIMRNSFGLHRDEVFDTSYMLDNLGTAAVDIALALTPLLTILAIAAVAGPLMVGGWLLSGKAITPQASRMSLPKGLKRMFSTRSLVELVKSVAKVLLVLIIALAILNARTENLLSIAASSPPNAMEHVLWTLAWSFFFLACATIVIAVIDVPFQIYDHKKKMRMTKQEVKDEFKDTEGKPEVKGKIRQLQREMANRRMMEKVPSADVVITNPDHYAVALRYDGDTMAAPIVVAKGNDETAFRIMAVAREHKVEVLRTPPLTRAIYFSTELDQPIPHGLYMAVAQVLAYLFQLRQFRRQGGDKPRMPHLPIPSDLRRDPD
ncbi:MAG: flagellar biosynthesis protein FlhB [Halomonadaceae bacterium]|nr:MAG: flagellar biosynthesis protein FlhB [Halomonadaceae bacterium]